MSGLRLATLVAVLAGEVAACLSGVLSPALLLVAVVVTVVGAVLSAVPGGRLALPLRRVATAAALLLAVLVVPQLATAGSGGPRAVLGPLLVGVAALQAWTWATRRDLQTGVLGALGLVVLGASFAPDVLIGLPLLIGWMAALVAGALAARERATEAADVVLTSPPPRVPLAAAAALAAVLGLVGFLLLPVPQDAGLRSRLAQAAQGAEASGRGQPGAYTGDRVDLRTRGDLSDEQVIAVPADSPRLWRSGVYTDWDGTAWTSSAGTRRLDGPPFLVAASQGPTRTDRVQVERRADGPVWAPGPVVSVALRGRTAGADELGSVRGRTAPGYEVTSEVVAPSLSALRAATGPDDSDPRWTALPAGVPARVRALGQQLVGSAPTRIDGVVAVERWLAANATYSLDSPVPGPGEDAVDRFLFVDRVGFCEQFAAAEVLLLRAAGVPARFVTGLGYGVEDDGVRSYRQKDLHAWAEVFHPGIGWVASDPTPPSTQLAGASLRTRVAAELTNALRRADDVPGGRPAIAAALLALTAAVAGALLLRRRRRPVAPRVAAGPVAVAARGRPALAAFLRYDARLGSRGRRPSESLAELRSRLDAPPEVVGALGVVEQECYAPAPPPAAPEAAGVLDRA